MGNNIAFQAQGKTYLASSNDSSQTVTVMSDSPCNQLMVSAPGGSNLVYFLVSSDPNVTVTAPDGTNAAACFVAVPGTQRCITIPQQFSNTANTYIAHITDANATASCLFTPGEGL